MTDKIPDIRYKETPEIHIKKRPCILVLNKYFGFNPDVIIIERAPGKTNWIRVRAILTPQEIEREKKIKENLKVISTNPNDRPNTQPAAK